METMGYSRACACDRDGVWRCAKGSAGADREHAVGACGPRESYDYVARVFQCPGGGNPFNGNSVAARQARVGSVGANAAGHIVDLYRVPCPRGPVEVYVDMYQCPPGRSPYR